MAAFSCIQWISTGNKIQQENVAVKWLSIKKEKIMGEHKQKLYSFRTDDELIEKLNILAERHSRTRNKEIEYALKQYVAACEQEEGKTNTGKLSVSKIG